MANLWVIMTGLGVLVERPFDPEAPGVVLMRKVFPNTDQVGNMSIPPHDPQLHRGGSNFIVPIAEREVEFFPQGVGRPTLSGTHRDLLLPVGRELEVASRIKDYIMTDSELNGISRIVLCGGQLEAIHIDKNCDLNEVSLDVSISLVGLFDPKLKEKTPIESKPIANGLLFKRTIPAEDGAFSVQIGGDPVDIEAVSKADMGVLRRDDDETDYVVWIVNVAPSAAPGSNSDTVEPEFLSLNGLPPKTALGFDRDFSLLYDWLEDSATVRHVPITFRKPAYDGEGDPPGQCMFGRVIG